MVILITTRDVPDNERLRVGRAEDVVNARLASERRREEAEREEIARETEAAIEELREVAGKYLKVLERHNFPDHYSLPHWRGEQRVVWVLYDFRGLDDTNFGILGLFLASNGDLIHAGMGYGRGTGTDAETFDDYLRKRRPFGSDYFLKDVRESIAYIRKRINRLQC